MKRMMSMNDTEEFVRDFLVQKHLEKNMKSLELKALLSVLNKALVHIGREIDIITLFESFKNLSYHIYVIEAKGRKESLKPYDDTNAQAIYIGIDPKDLKRLKNILSDFKNSPHLDIAHKELLVKLLYRN